MKNADRVARQCRKQQETMIEKMLAEVARNREEMQRDQEEIDRLKVRTRAMLKQLEAA